jgi:hypothetical protein
MRIAPDDAVVKSAYREAGQRLAGVSRPQPEPVDTRETTANLAAWVELDVESTMHGSEADEATDHARVEDLTRKLHADPTDDRVVDELATRLLRLGRTHELFALLSARLDEAGDDRREALLPKQREVLGRLEDDARAAGRDDEAALYREARQMLD